MKESRDVFPNVRTSSNTFWLQMASVLLSLTVLLPAQAAAVEGEKEIIHALMSHKSESAKKIDLEQLFGKRWDALCIQAPYILQEPFEKIVGRKIERFEALSDTYTAIWLFRNDQAYKFKINRISQGDYFSLKGPACVDVHNGYFVIETVATTNKYYLMTKE